MKFKCCLCSALAVAGAAILISSPVAAQPVIDITQQVDVFGFRKPIPVYLSGFTGEVLAALKQDLLFMGFASVPQDQAKFVISGSGAGRVEARVTEKFNNRSVLAKAYSGGSLRTQVHALADDVCRGITPEEKPIAQTKIAFKVEIGGGNSEVYIADYDGFNSRAITRDNTIVTAPCWVGPGTLLYATYKLGRPMIYSQELSTGARAPVARHPGANMSPAVSPNGRRLAMILSKNGSPDLYVANIDGSNVKQLTFTREAESSPCWAPDNETIAFCSRSAGVAQLFKVSASGSSPVRLATVGAPSPTEPDWSPDGRWIAFTSMTRSFQICFVPAKGGDAVVLAEGEDPSWAPNSRALIFCRGADHAKHLCLLDVPTRQVKDIGRISGSNSQPSWAK